MHDSVVFLYLSHFVLSLLKLQTWFGSITCRQISKKLYYRCASGFFQSASCICDHNNVHPTTWHQQHQFFWALSFSWCWETCDGKEAFKGGLLGPRRFFWKMYGVYMILPPLEIPLMLRKMICAYTIWYILIFEFSFQHRNVANTKQQFDRNFNLNMRRHDHVRSTSV